MTRRLVRIFPATLFLFGLSLCAVAILSFFYIPRGQFEWRGTRWEIRCRGTVIQINNEPERLRQRQEALRDYSREQLQPAYEYLPHRYDMSHEAPELHYAAAYLWVDGYGFEYGQRWTPPPALPLIDHRYSIFWLVLLLSIPWIVARARRRGVGAALIFAPAWVLFGLVPTILCVIVAACWIHSFQKTYALTFYLPDSVRPAVVDRGQIAFIAPPQTDPLKLAAMRLLASRVQNDDVTWIIEPPEIPLLQAGNPRPGSPNVAGITARIRANSPLAEINDDVADNPEEIKQVMLEALRDPDRYLAAHAFLSQRLYHADPTAGRILGQRSMLDYIYPGATYSDPDFVLSPEQLASRHEVVIAVPEIVPGQRPFIEAKWRRFLCPPGAPVSFAYAFPLLIFPACWLVAIISNWRRRRGPNQCASCGYNLTGNVTGICSECGTPVRAGVAT